MKISDMDDETYAKYRKAWERRSGLRLITPEEFYSILDLHSKWLNGDSDGVRADFSHAAMCWVDFSKYDLRGAIFDYASFRWYEYTLAGCDLTGCSFNRTELHGVDLSGANLNGVNLIRTKLCWANLTGAKLRAVDGFMADFTAANLTGADLSCSKFLRSGFCDAVMVGTNLRESDLTGSFMIDTDLTGADIKYADLTAVRKREP